MVAQLIFLWISCILKLRKFEVSYKHFENATYNAATETIYITGQSPIKDGTITVSKTTLDLATGSDSFLTQTLPVRMHSTRHTSY